MRASFVVLALQVVSVTMWMWLARILCSLGLLGFVMQNKRQGKIAMLSAAGITLCEGMSKRHVSA